MDRWILSFYYVNASVGLVLICLVRSNGVEDFLASFYYYRRLSLTIFVTALSDSQCSRTHHFAASGPKIARIKRSGMDELTNCQLRCFWSHFLLFKLLCLEYACSE